MGVKEPGATLKQGLAGGSARQQQRRRVRPASIAAIELGGGVAMAESAG